MRRRPHCLLHEYVNAPCFIFSRFRTKAIHINLDALFLRGIKAGTVSLCLYPEQHGGGKADPSLSPDKGLKKRVNKSGEK